MAEQGEDGRQSITGSYSAQADRGGTATVSVTHQAPLTPISAAPPKPPPHFTGRRRHLESLKAAVLDNQATALTAIQGMGGIGKTATAQRLAAELADSFQGGIFWADLPGSEGDPQPILRAWARECAQDLSAEPDLVALASLVRGLLVARRAEQGPLLVIVDDVRRKWLEAARILHKAVPAGIPLLVTTRDETLAVTLGLAVHRLDEMEPAEALALLKSLAGDGAILVDEEPETAASFLKTVGHLPLAVVLAGAQLALKGRKPGYRLGTLYQAVLDKADKALALPGHPGLVATFAVTYNILPSDQQRLFRLLGVFASRTVSLSAAAGILGSEEAEAEAGLDALVSYALLAFGETAGVYTLHPLLGQYAQTLLAEADEGEEVRHRHLTYFLAFAKANARDEPEAHNQLEAALPELLAAADYARRAHEYQAVSDFASALYGDSHFLDLRANARESVALLDSAVEACCRLGDRRGEGNHLGHLGNAYADLGQVKEAINHYEQALIISREIGDRSGEGNHLGNLGLAYLSLGQAEQAIEYCEAALVIHREIGDRRGEGNRLSNLGIIYQDLGKMEQAIDYHEQALTIHREIDDRRGKGADLGNLGNAYYRLGQVEQAIEYLEQALAIHQEIGDRRGEGVDLGNLGLAYAALGQVERAIRYCERALAISREIDDRRGEGLDLGNLGSAYADLGQVGRAIKYHERALAIAQEIGDRSGEGVALGNLGSALRQLGQVERAIEYCERALAINREIGDRHGEGNDLGNLGIAYRHLGQVERAIEYCQQALAIFRETGNRRGEGNYLGNLALAYADSGQLERASEYCEQALAISREIGDRRGEGVELGNLGRIYADSGQLEQAIEYCEQALAIHRAIGDRRGEGNRLDKLGIAYRRLGQVERAIDYCEQALAIARELGDQRSEAIRSWHLGLLYEERDPARAIELMTPSIVYKQEIGHPDAAADAEHVAQIRARLEQ